MVATLFEISSDSNDNYKFSFFPRTIRHCNSLQANVAETGALRFVNINYPARPCKYTLVISLRYTAGDFVCPGTRREGSLVKGSGFSVEDRIALAKTNYRKRLSDTWWILSICLRTRLGHGLCLFLCQVHRRSIEIRASQIVGC